MLTADGASHPILRLENDPARNRSVFEALPPLFRVHQVLGPKPGAQVLLAHPALQCEGGAMPLTVVGRYGAGKVFYNGFGSTWRWRFYDQEKYCETFWLQTIRFLCRNKLVGRQRRAHDGRAGGVRCLRDLRAHRQGVDRWFEPSFLQRRMPPKGSRFVRTWARLIRAPS